MTDEWTRPEHAEEYLAQMKGIPHRVEGFKKVTDSNDGDFGIDDNPTKAEIQWLDDQLDTFNEQQVGYDDFKPMSFVIRDAQGTIIAGLKSVTGWGWLYVHVLWVHENHRRTGIGTRLLEQAEQEAKRRGCIGACLTSYGFQAPEFYQLHGYSTFGEIANYSADNTMFFFSKRFAGDAS